ncbi:hypothetical protein Dimus_029152 [Dionaea muscipula]
MLLLDESVTDRFSGKRVVDGDELQERDVGLVVLSSPCSLVRASSPLQFADTEDRGCGDLVSAVGTDIVLSSPCFSYLGSTALSCSDSEVTGVAEAVGASKCPATLSSMVCNPLSSRSQWPHFPVCVGEQGNKVVGEGVEQPLSVELGVGGDRGLEEVDGGAGGDAMVLPTEPVGSRLPCVPSLPVSDVVTIADGL